MKQRIKPAIWKIRKQKTPNQNSKKKKELKSEDSIRSLWDNFKFYNICIIGVPKGEERMQGIENLCGKIKSKLL